MFTEEQQQKLVELVKTAQAKIEELTGNLNSAAQTIKEQADLIAQLSSDNLKLVEKLDQLTGKKAPGKTYGA